MPKRTAEKLIKSMYHLMGEVGYEKASINKICSNVCITKSSFYHFFQSKEQVLLEIVKEICEEDYIKLWAELLEVADANRYKSKMLKIADDILSSYENDIEFRKVYAEIILQSERIPEILSILNKSDQERMSTLNAVLEHGAKIGAFSNDFNVKLNSEIIYSILLGLDHIILYSIPIRSKEVIKEVLERIFKK